jgi:hypothetical protein
MDIKPERRQFRLPAIAESVKFIGAAFLTWLLASFDPIGILFPLLVIFLIARWLANRHWWTATLYFCLLPTTLAGGQGLVDYFRSNAALRYSGLPGTTFHNLDPTYRCGRVTYGCLVYGNEWLTQAPYNFVVTRLIRCFGPMSGTYTGPYPSDEESAAALKTAAEVDSGALAADRLQVGGSEIQLASGVGRRLIEAADYDENSIFRRFRAVPPIKAVIWQNDCLILSIPSLRHEESGSAMIALFDRTRGRPFAYYGVGDYYHRFPPVRWTPLD